MTAIFLILVALVHLYRALVELPLIAGKYHVPIWMSWIAVFLTLGLAISLWKEHRNTK